MTDVSNNGMFEPDEVGRLLDLDGATVDDAGPEDPAEPTDRDTDGTPVGRADYEADAAPR